MSEAPLTAQAIIESLVESFQPQNTQTTQIILGITLTGEKGGDWHINIDNGTCRVRPGKDENANVTMISAPDDFVSLVQGTLNPQKALMTGKLKFQGNMMLLMNFEKWFALQ